jgi:hypothetical protein
MQLLLSAASHILSYLDRKGGPPSDPPTIRKIVARSNAELSDIRHHYQRAAENSTRIVYAGGMLRGTLLLAALGGIAGLVLWAAGAFEQHSTATWTILATVAAGGAGAAVSVLLRMARGSFSQDYTKTATQGCPGISKGRISNVKADKRVRLSAYWELNPGSRVPVSKERLNAIGRVVHFRVDINGYRGKQLTVWWWMLTANGEPVPEPTLRRQLAFGLTPHDCTTGGTREIWAELPKRNGRFQVEIQLLDPNDEKLDYGRTAPFAVRSPATRGA